MIKASKREIKKYYRDIKRLLTCPPGMKAAFIADLQSRIDEFGEGDEMTLSDIMLEFGTPDSIAKNFDTYDDLKNLKIKARKYKKKQLLIISLFSIVMLTLILLIVYMYYSQVGTVVRYITYIY